MRERLKITMSYKGLSLPIDITDEIIGLENVAFSAQRDWFSGIISEIKIDMNVHKSENTKVLEILYEKWLNNEPEENYLVTIKVILYDNIEGIETVEKIFYVNFNTLKNYRHKYAFNLETPNILSWINSKGTQEAKIKVKDVPDRLSMDYSPMVLPCKAIWNGAKGIVQDSKELTGTTHYQIVVVQLDFSRIEGVPEGQSILFCRQQMAQIFEAEWDGGGATPYFDANKNNCAFLSSTVDGYTEVHLNIKFLLAFFLMDKREDTKYNLIIAKFNGKKQTEIIYETQEKVAALNPNSISLYQGRNTSDYPTSDYFDVEYEGTVFLARGEQLVMYIRVDATNNDWYSFKGDVLVCYEEFSRFEATWEQKSTSVNGGADLSIDTVSVEGLFNATLNALGAPNGYGVSIEWDEPFDNKPRFIAAESANRTSELAQTEPPYFHSKINDIMQCLQVMGYEYTVSKDQKRLIFKRRHKIFETLGGDTLSPARIKKEYTFHDTDHTYTRLKIGYQKSDIDNPVGKYDPVGVTMHDTGIVLPQAKECELVSPIRADLFGIEQLTWKQWKKGVDREDNDIFLIDCVVAKNGRLKVWNKIHIDYTVEGKTLTFYNALRTPLANIVLNNADLLYSFCNQYYYTSGNVYYNANGYYTLITNATFTPSEGKLWRRLNGLFTLDTVNRYSFDAPFKPLFKRQLMKLSVGTLQIIDVNSPVKVFDDEGNLLVGYVKQYDYKILTNGGGELELYLAKESNN